MQIFVSEYVCGGAWSGEQLNSSLAREGQAMLTALVEDLSKIPGVRVVTTWDARLGECPLSNCDVSVIESLADEERLFRELIRNSDAVWIIAPETDNQLALRGLMFLEENAVDSSQTQSLQFFGPSLEAVQVCSDKLTLARLLLDNSIATPLTKPFVPIWEHSHWWNWPQWPSVIKPRDGAGSQNTFLVRNSIELWNACRELNVVLKPLSQEWPTPPARTGERGGVSPPMASTTDRGADAAPLADTRAKKTLRVSTRASWDFVPFIHQPYVVGKALSVALLIAADGSIIETLPVTEQHLSDDGRFRYLGGRIPADISAESSFDVQQLAQRACHAVPGLAGYVGCDIVLPHPGHVENVLHEEEPVLIEINPRLTTSYLGYRKLTDDNIAARLIDPSTPPLRWKSEAVTFTV